MHPFDDLNDVQPAVQRVKTRQPPLVKVLARQPGTKESRYVHLLSGDVKPASSPGAHEGPAVSGRENADKVSRLESEVAELRGDIADLKQQFAALRKQSD